MDKCGHCANSRPVISENGWHFVCALHHIAARNCMLDTKNIAEALKKQIPKKPVVCTDNRLVFDFLDEPCGIYEVNIFECPVCSNYIADVDECSFHNYCKDCGQALDWGQDNG